MPQRRFRRYIAYTFTLAVLAAPSLAVADIVGINTNDRAALSTYVNDLPADKRHAGAQFRVGETLPKNASTQNLPASLAAKIEPAPAGYSYVQAGTDVYLIDSRRQIIDRVGTR